MAELGTANIGGRAVPAWVLESTAEEIDNGINGTKWFSRQNLLDNWYFGTPVDQREGKIIPAGKPYYTTPDITLPEVGKTDKAYTVIEIKNYSGYGQRATISIGGTVYYAWDQNAVRGYAGSWVYTIDRWRLGDGNVSLSVADGGIALKGGGVVGSDYIFTRVERLPVAKYTYTILFSGNTDQVVLSNKLTDTGVVTAVTSRAASGVLSLTWDQTTEFTSLDAFLRIHAPGSVNILAAKLELGPTQTLAHQENGVWVLNEIPNYGEQLMRCQRYFYRRKGANPYSYYGNGYIDSANGAFIFINVPEMRVEPTVAASGKFILSIPGKPIAVTSISYGGASTNGFNRISVSATSSLTSNTPVMLQADNDTSAYIDFSADL